MRLPPDSSTKICRDGCGCRRAKGRIRAEGLSICFDYRGDVTITLKNGGAVEGYIFDRRAGATLADSCIRLFPKGDPTKVTVPYSEIVSLSFTGRDTAAGKSWEAWLKKYWEKKAAGETNIELQPEKLD